MRLALSYRLHASSTERIRNLSVAFIAALSILGFCSIAAAIPASAKTMNCMQYRQQIDHSERLADESDIYSKENDDVRAKSFFAAAKHALDTAEIYGDIGTCVPDMNSQMEYFSLVLRLAYPGQDLVVLKATEKYANGLLRDFVKYSNRPQYHDLQKWAYLIHGLVKSDEKIEKDLARIEKDGRHTPKVAPANCLPDRNASVVNLQSPETPAIAEQDHIFGGVEVQVQLSETSKIIGTPTAVSGPSVLRKAAVDAIRQSTFLSEIRECVPRASTLTVTVEFTGS